MGCIRVLLLLGVWSACVCGQRPSSTLAPSTFTKPPSWILATTPQNPCSGTFCGDGAQCKVVLMGRKQSAKCDCGDDRLKYNSARDVCMEKTCADLGCDKCITTASTSWNNLKKCTCSNYGEKLDLDGKKCVVDPLATPTCFWPKNPYGCDHSCRMKTINRKRLPVCSCRRGYTLDVDGKTCLVTNGCLADNSNGGCDHECKSLGGKDVKCSCPSTHTLNTDKKTCLLKSCNNKNTGCDHDCHQGGDDFWFCTCPHGYELQADGTTCIDVDECTRNPGCQQRCVTTPDDHYYRCDCNIGYTLSADRHACEREDPCTNGNAGCSQFCDSSDGSCSCRSGYTLNSDKRTCSDINECDFNNGGCSDMCTNTPGSFVCSCPSRKLLNNDERTCVEHQCSYPHKPVDGSQPVCTGRSLGDKCTFSCDAGYTLVGNPVLKCNANGVWSHDQPQCEDTNECRLQTHTCQHGCFNKKGGFVCSCNTNYALAADGFSCVPKQDRPVTKSCPLNMEAETVPGQNYAVFSWPTPSVVSVLTSQPLQCSQPCPSGTNRVKCLGQACSGGTSFTGQFPVGSHQIKYNYPLGGLCEFKLITRDNEKPKVSNCPPDTEVTLTSTSLYTATWTPPKFTDNSGGSLKYIYSFNSSSLEFLPGNHTITYGATDESENFAECTFLLSVIKPVCPPLSAPVDGMTGCDSGSLTVNCHPSCKAGYAFYEPPHDRYHCDAGGQWAPSSTPPDCFPTAQPFAGTIQFDATYTFACPVKSDEISSISSLIRNQFDVNKQIFCINTKSCDLMPGSPAISCSGGTLSVSITTNDAIFTVRNLTMMMTEFKARIHNEQVAQPALFSIATFSRTPSIYAPNSFSDGVIIHPKFDLTCPSGFSQVEDKCVQCPPNVSC